MALAFFVQPGEEQALESATGTNIDAIDYVRSCVNAQVRRRERKNEERLPMLLLLLHTPKASDASRSVAEHVPTRSLRALNTWRKLA